MSNDNAGGLLANPLPIVMVALLAAGVLIKQVPLESARPNDSERVKFVPVAQQDVEARLWQDPFAAVEKHEERSKFTTLTLEELRQIIQKIQNAGGQTEVKAADQKHKESPPAPHTPGELQEKIRKAPGQVKVIGVSVFGDPYSEAAENRRRRRFAVISALRTHGYNPAESGAIGYFRIQLSDGEKDVKWPASGSPGLDFNLIGPAGSKMLLELVNGKPASETVDLTVPYEWFERRQPLSDESDGPSDVLVLWLNEDKLGVGTVGKLRSLIRQLTPDQSKGLLKKKNELLSTNGQLPQIFAPSATIPNCDLVASIGIKPWNCFMINEPNLQKELQGLSIVRTIGTDDVLAAALLWELWQRGVNRKLVYKDLPTPTSSKSSTSQNPASPVRGCMDGLVLISEWDSEYARALSRNLSKGFQARCRAGGETTSAVRGFTYLRGLDGILPDIDKTSANVPRKDEGSKAKDLRAQLEDAPPEHAEGRSQYDYLRRLGDEIARLDGDTQFAGNGVKAIGIVGSDAYDKLLILQALHMRFKDKIFFTTDLDARYLHADQKEWVRNLVVASNFDLSLRPALQQSTLPFRDGYQTATYLAALMTLEAKSLEYWNRKLKNWLRPQIFEIGRTGATHLASPSVQDLTRWIESGYSDGNAPPAGDAVCDDTWVTCNNIEPKRPPQGIPLDHLVAISFLILLGGLSVGLLSPSVQETARAAYDGLTSSVSAEARVARLWLIIVSALLFTLLATVVVVHRAMDASFAKGAGEPFVWLEGISVWPSIVLRFVGFITMIALVIGFTIWIRRQAHLISKDFDLSIPQTWKLARSSWSAALIGPHLDLASFGSDGKINLKPTGEGVEITTLWQNYLRATSWREMTLWIVAAILIVMLLGSVPFYLFGRPSFPHRGDLVDTLHHALTFPNVALLWVVIFWVGYETRTCARFVAVLSDVKSVWPKSLLDREEDKTGVPRAHLDDYLDFQLITSATRRIHRLIYLPFVLLLFLVLARSSLFDAMDFPLALLFVTGLALAYAIYTAVSLRRSAEAARAKAIEHYNTRLLAQTRPKDSPPSVTAGAAAANPTPISAEQIKLLMERIRNTREGAFAPFTQQPALQALLLPFGGYGGVQLVEYLINF